MQHVKNSKKTTSEKIGNAFWLFWQKFHLSGAVRHKKIGDGYSKIRFNGGERFTEIFDGGIFAIILDAKIEGNCI